MSPFPKRCSPILCKTETTPEHHNLHYQTILQVFPLGQVCRKAQHGITVTALPVGSCPLLSAVQTACLEPASRRSKTTRQGKVCLWAVLLQKHPSSIQWRKKRKLGAAPLFKVTELLPSRVSTTTITPPPQISGTLDTKHSPAPSPPFSITTAKHTSLKRGTCGRITKQIAWNGVAFQSMGLASKSHI